jgi:hypothetical protein
MGLFNSRSSSGPISRKFGMIDQGGAREPLEPVLDPAVGLDPDANHELPTWAFHEPPPVITRLREDPFLSRFVPNDLSIRKYSETMRLSITGVLASVMISGCVCFICLRPYWRYACNVSRPGEADALRARIREGNLLTLSSVIFVGSFTMVVGMWQESRRMQVLIREFFDE